MAEIDKSLPNEVKPLETEETQQELEVITPGDTASSEEGTEIMENEDGSVDINFDPSAMIAEESKNHYANLADFMDDTILSRLGSDLYQSYQDYRNSRKDWRQHINKD
jgi:hypothetical protein